MLLKIGKEGISIEIIDPRTLVPFDKETILKSVEKTGRLVVVDPAHKVCSAASEIISVVTEEGFWNLQAPPVKVASEQVHIPFSPALEPLIYILPKKKLLKLSKRHWSKKHGNKYFFTSMGNGHAGSYNN